MSEQPRSERKTQNRVIALFTDKARPGCLGEWKTRALKQGMMQELLTGRTRLR
jgi:type I restriction enzyme R subunit